MAERPVFIPATQGVELVRTVPIHFDWHSGMAASQKKKNIVAMHAQAARIGIEPLLEISSKSECNLGQSLSAFNLTFRSDFGRTTVECAYQASKLFEHGGPYLDLLQTDSRSAKRDPRLKESGRLVGFEFAGERYPLWPSTAFYDWLYICALARHHELQDQLSQYVGFTDIEFNPQKSINCQARSCALYVALVKRNELGDALDSFREFYRYSYSNFAVEKASA